MSNSASVYMPVQVRWGTWLFALTLFVVSNSPAQSRGISELDLALARETATVTNTQDRRFVGRLDGFRDGRLYISTATDGGEVGYSFAPDEIKELVLPGEETAAQAIELWERKDYNQALPRLTSLGRQRLRYLPILNFRQREPLVALVHAMIATGDPGGAIGRARLIQPYATESQETTILNDATLTGNLALGFEREARRLAEQWCAAANPSGASALGWKVLAQLAYDGGDFERALWVALQPIAFSSFLPMAHLDTCYALAVASAHRLEDSNQALQLYRDMRRRNLPWPVAPELTAIEFHYSRLLANEAERQTAADRIDESEDESLQPAEDLALPLKKVRKIITGPDS